VQKIQTGGRTVLQVVPIPGEARVEEIARLLGGHKSGAKGGVDKQVAYAKQLLGHS
jgi:DNA repair ATPase RecN